MKAKIKKVASKVSKKALKAIDYSLLERCHLKNYHSVDLKTKDIVLNSLKLYMQSDIKRLDTAIVSRALQVKILKIALFDIKSFELLMLDTARELKVDYQAKKVNECDNVRKRVAVNNVVARILNRFDLVQLHDKKSKERHEKKLIALKLIKVDTVKKAKKVSVKKASKKATKKVSKK